MDAQAALPLRLKVALNGPGRLVIASSVAAREPN
jgi:hypothetical protein